MWIYTTILHNVRVELGLSLVQYAYLDLVYKTQTNPGYSKNGWADISDEFIGDSLGFKRTTAWRISKKLEDIGLLEKDGKLKRTTSSFWKKMLQNATKEKDENPVLLQNATKNVAKCNNTPYINIKESKREPEGSKATSEKKKRDVALAAGATRHTAATPGDLAVVFDRHHESLFGVKYNWGMKGKEFGCLKNISKMISSQTKKELSPEEKIAAFESILSFAAKDDFIRGNLFTPAGILSQFTKIIQKIALSNPVNTEYPPDFPDEKKPVYERWRKHFGEVFPHCYRDFGFFSPNDFLKIEDYTKLYEMAKFHMTKRSYESYFKKVLTTLEHDSFRKTKCSDLFSYVKDEIKKLSNPNR